MGDFLTVQELAMAIGLFVVISIVVIGITLKDIDNKRRGKVKKKKKKTDRKGLFAMVPDKTMLRIYIKLDKFFLTGGTIRKVTRQIQSLSLYDLRDTYALAADYVMTSIVAAIVFTGLAFLMFDDAISIALCTVFGLIFSSVMVDKRVDKINIKVYNQLRFALSSISEEFRRNNGSVADAIQDAEYGKELKGVFDSIHNILTTSNAELKLKEFFEKVPFRHIQTLARVCYDINNTGDEVDEYGQSNFLQAMTTMTTDVTQELQRMEYQKMMFGPIEYLTLIPVLGIKLIESFFVGIMPGTAVIYDGSAGYIVRISTLVLSVILYTIIAKINTSQSLAEDDRSKVMCVALHKHKILRKFVYGLIPRNYASKKHPLQPIMNRTKAENKLKMALSKKKLDEFYLEKITFGAAAFVMSILAIVCAVQMGKQHMLTSVQSLSLVDMEASVQIPKDVLLKMDADYMDMVVSGKKLKVEDQMLFVEGYCNGLSEMEIQDQQKRMEMKTKTILNSYFKWYYVLVSFGLGFLGWMLPNMLLNLRKWLVGVEAEEDFLQLQTLMTILMKTDCDTLDALEQMSQIAKIHKDMLLYCYHSYPSNPDKELSRLESRTPLMEFKRFIGKMKLTTSDMSLRDAFSDLTVEREYIQTKRDLKMRESIENKRRKCGMLSKLPMGIMVVGEFIYPIAYLGVTELISAVGSMNSL